MRSGGKGMWGRGLALYKQNYLNPGTLFSLYFSLHSLQYNSTVLKPRQIIRCLELLPWGPNGGVPCRAGYSNAGMSLQHSGELTSV
jgi:hypothetical protein